MNRLLIGITLVFLACVSVFVYLNPMSTIDQNSKECSIEQCHGLDITCGANAPDQCTLEYHLGDFCRMFINCKVSAGICTTVVDDTFALCKDCVESCQQEDLVDASDCENECRMLFDNNYESQY